MKNLAVCGCSFSDYTSVHKVYGEWIAEGLGLNYIHYAKGGGSNHRSIYASARGIISGELGPQDILVFQITDPHRKILPSFEPDFLDIYGKGNEVGLPGKPDRWSTPYGDAWTTDYKTSSHSWQGPYTPGSVSYLNARLHKALEVGGVNNEYETDLLRVQLHMLEALCKQHGVDIIFVETRYIAFINFKDPSQNFRKQSQNDIAGDVSTLMTKESAQKKFIETDFIKVGSASEPCEYDLGFGDWHGNTEYDHSHLSEKGHQYLGELLTTHIRRHVVDRRL